jgi:hypothetical protein
VLAIDQAAIGQADAAVEGQAIIGLAPLLTLTVKAARVTVSIPVV